MNTRDLIISKGNKLLLEKGFSAFSYADISEQIQIKKASIHYHFPKKTDLGIAIIDQQKNWIEELGSKQTHLTETQKLQQLANYYMMLISEQKICLMGALASDAGNIEIALKEKCTEFSDAILKHTTEIIKAGILNNEFLPVENPEDRAIQLLSSFMGLAQLARIYNKEKIINILEQTIHQLKP